MLKSLPILEQCTAEESQVLLTLYEAKLKKFHTPVPESNKNLFGESLYTSQHNLLSIFTQNVAQSSPQTPFCKVTSMSISTPNIVKNNDKNLQESEGNKSKQLDDVQQMHVDYVENPIGAKLRNNLDLQVAEAERLYYNCDYHQCNQLTEAILKEDPYHDVCLPIHISCQVEMKQSNSKHEFFSEMLDLVKLIYYVLSRTVHFGS